MDTATLANTNVLSDSSWMQFTLRQVDAYRCQFLSQAQALRRAADYQAESGGKRLRPMILLCFASQGQQGGKATQTALRAAAAIELLHEASLVHDDVLDQSPIRRGRASIPEKFGVSTAINLGNFMVGIAVSVLAEISEAAGASLDFELLQVLSRAQLEEGLSPHRNLSIGRQRCLRVIQGKTGSLFKMSAQVGTSLSHEANSRELITRSATPFSEHLALAFQLRDDLADLQNNDCIRKPGGNDFLHGLATLPFQIWAASQPDTDVARERLLGCRNSIAATEALQQEILSGPVHREIQETIRSELQAARTLLKPFPASLARNVLDSVLSQLLPGI